MLVANDVTRDSRVLREAATLASAGHRVTVLGIKTARTTAPDEEIRDGFRIRRLPYRARPPGWWVPPDFYARVRQRADRQYRIHSARLRSRWTRARRRAGHSRWARAGARRATRWRLRIGRVWHLVWGARPPQEAVRTPAFRRYRRRRLARWAAILGRAQRTPLREWPGKVRGRLVGVRLLPAIRSTRRMSSAPRGVLRAAAQLAAVPRRALGFVRRVGQPWMSIVGMLLWGTLYLGANAASRGSLEWLAGWRWRWLGWARYLQTVAPDADAWHAHDLTSLPAAIALKRSRGGVAVYDSHEVYLESGTHARRAAWAKSRLAKLERSLSREADAILTVNASVAEELARRLERDDVRVLHNCPSVSEPNSDAAPLRRTLGLDDGVPLLLYHGALAPHRGIEQLLAAVRRPELEHAHLAFLGFGQLTEWLRHEATRPKYRGRVHVVDAVPPDQLPRWLAGVDVAVAPIQPSTLNHRLSSPNKVFEAIAAGTPVAGSDFPEFRRVILDPTYGPLGTVFDPDRPSEIAAAVLRILDMPDAERAALRRRCLRASAERWNWDRESRALLDVYAALAAPMIPQRGRAVAVAS
jgi:glycosyltransferase involved in cell wall biosynthesis